MRRFGFTLCEGPCGRLTRDSKIKIADAPGTVVRAKDGKCKACAFGNGQDRTGPDSDPRGLSGERVCTGTCGRMTRNSRMLERHHPNTVNRVKDGMCPRCRDEAYPEYAERRRVRQRKRPYRHPIPPEPEITAARAALESYLASRRGRTTNQRRRAA